MQAASRKENKDTTNFVKHYRKGE